MENSCQEEIYKELSNIHDAVKNHPWRMEFQDKYLKDYRSLLYKFSGKFFDIIKNSEQTKIAEHPPYGFEHDFNSAIFGLPQEYAIIHVERCIGSIHKFIDTNNFDEYYTYYSGCNIFKSFCRLRKFVWNSKNWIPIYTKEELEGAIKETEDYLLNKNGKFDDYGRYTKTTYEYLKKKLNESVI